MSLVVNKLSLSLSLPLSLSLFQETNVNFFRFVVVSTPQFGNFMNAF